MKACTNRRNRHETVIDLWGTYPKNKAHFLELLEFYREVVSLCGDLNITPVLSGSLAVFAYTRDQTLEVHDIDLACSEAAFPKLSHALSARGIEGSLKAWNVLQVRWGALKLEFDSLEHWMHGLPKDFDTLNIEGTLFRVYSLASLTELYRRGLEATADGGQAASPIKHAAILEKYRTLHRLAAQ